jgi:hypothetical protein
MANLTEYLQGKRPKRFQSRAHYVAEGDTLIVYFKDDESHAERVDELLTVYRSMRTGEMVGCQIKSARLILRKLGNFGVHVKDGNVDLRVLFIAYAFASKKIPPSETLEELRHAAESSHARLPLDEFVTA